VTTTYQPRVAQVSGPIEFWCRDLVSCLQSTFATVLSHAGHDPLEVLGAHWEFRFRAGDVRPEEFYYPCAVPGDLAASLAPHHPVSSTWRRPAASGGGDDPAGLMADIISTLADGQLVIAAVDNFFLPFRPAFGDVHAAHLLVVYGVDLTDGRVHVSDAMPPAFRGPIEVADFTRAWSSANPADVQDVFFSDARIDRRFMTVAIGEPFPKLDRPMLKSVLGANLAAFRSGDDRDWVGIDGLERYLATLLDACAVGDAGPLADLYPFGWGMQAQTSLHAELLRSWGVLAAVPELTESGRLVESVAHAWTGLRMTAAHGRDDPKTCARDLAKHARALRHYYELALASLDDAVELL
jgi:hypothetical protein